MKLLKLLRCDIYRDGGSLEGTWLTDENKEWSITLKINDWDKPDDPKSYNLFNSSLSQTEQDHRILKDSPEHDQILTLIKNWVSINNIRLLGLENDRVHDLLFELEKGNY